MCLWGEEKGGAKASQGRVVCCEEGNYSVGVALWDVRGRGGDHLGGSWSCGRKVQRDVGCPIG